MSESKIYLIHHKLYLNHCTRTKVLKPWTFNLKNNKASFKIANNLKRLVDDQLSPAFCIMSNTKFDGWSDNEKKQKKQKKKQHLK